MVSYKFWRPLLVQAVLLLSPQAVSAQTGKTRTKQGNPPAPIFDIIFADDASFQILVHGEVWFSSSRLRLFADGQWHDTRTWNDLEASLVRTSVQRTRGIDELGAYFSTNVSWTVSRSGIALHTTLKAYNDGVTAMFVQEVPGGASNTNASNPQLPGGTQLEHGEHPAVISFPAFSASLGRLQHLGYVTWQGCMVNIDFGVNAPQHLQGLSSNGPVAIFDNDSETTTVVVSPLDNFKNAVHSYSSETDAWDAGVSSEVESLPVGFVHRTLVVAGSGVTATMHAWGNIVRKVYGTYRMDNTDLATNYLSYWTDNGAYYYGDAWGESGGGGGTCNEQAMLEVATSLEQQNLLNSVKLWQLDDWWYPGQRKVYVHCVHNWTLSAPAFNHSLGWLSQKLKTPWLLYVPFFCPDNIYTKTFEFVLSTPGDTQFAEPHPDHAADFYRMLFEYGVRNGMRGYENDFLNFNFLSIPLFRKNLGSARKWLQGIDAAATEFKVPVQMCMALPSDLMQSVELNSVTNYRASSDYAASENFDIGGSALLAFALGLHPSKDNFWTHRPRSAIETGQPWGPASNPGSNCELNIIIATLSTGPVGIADKAGDTNKTLVLRSIRHDGLILQPDRPASYVDSMFLQKLGGTAQPLHGQVWNTFSAAPKSSGGVASWHYLLSIDVMPKWRPSFADFYPQMACQFGCVARRWHEGHMPRFCLPGKAALQSGCVMASFHKEADMPSILNDRPIMVENDTHVFDLLQFSPIAANGWVLLGELGKYVSVSSKRFTEVHYTASGLNLMVTGSAGETVAITALRPDSSTTEQDWIIVRRNVPFHTDGVQAVSFSSGSALDSLHAFV